MEKFIFGFFIGSCLTDCVCILVYLINVVKYKQKVSELEYKLNAGTDVQEMLKQNFKQIALETLCNEKESLNKQNNESLEAKIKPLTEKINEFQSKIDNYNILGTQNTTKIIEQIGILEKNNKTIEKETKNHKRLRKAQKSCNLNYF